MLVGVEPEPLLEALVEIEGLITHSGSPLPLRAGFTTGPVILIDGDDYVGHAVNLAARLCAAAEPRQVLAIADDIVHLYTDIVSVPAGRREIPGVEDPVDVVAIRR
jgi:class 3 adenylate cyclase